MLVPIKIVYTFALQIDKVKQLNAHVRHHHPNLKR